MISLDFKGDGNITTDKRTYRGGRRRPMDRGDSVYRYEGSQSTEPKITDVGIQERVEKKGVTSPGPGRTVCVFRELYFS